VSDKSKEPKDLLALPPGFTAKPISRVGREMSDKLLTPGKHDGMAAFPGPGGRTLLVCNHECDALDFTAGAFGDRNERLRNVDASRFYDFGSGKAPALGGTTTLLFNTRTQTVEREHLSLAGTIRNCAGGPTPWGSWITCEETVQPREGDFEQDHGYTFEVPADATELCAAVPMKAMGRFNHEAVAVHPRSGIVYQTEDRGDGLIYRFIPKRPPQEAGDLLRSGGRLQALKVRDVKSLDTRNWRQVKVRPGQRMAVEWVDLENVESPEDDLRLQGFYGRGAARFARGEGMWYGRGAVYWCCTNGGKKQKGQIWRYRPSANEGLPEEELSPGTLELFVEPEDGNVAENCDNLTVSPWGDLFVCEDNGQGHNKLLRVTQSGKIFEFARNIVNRSELAGVTFSPDGTTLFVNIQFPGTSVAITGAWGSLQDTLLTNA
jgi:secreted PhoX family phosphatase